jgi:putative hydroxymethylpyrimidine transport system substrate-binding protein
VRFVTTAGHSSRRLKATLAVSLLIVATLVAGTLPRLTNQPLGPAGPAALAQDLTPVTVALDWYPNANHAGLYLAQERGYFAEAGLAVDLYTPADPTTVLQTVAAGRDTFGISYQTDVLLARAEEIPVVSIAALVQRPLLGIMVLAESGITRPGDLAGKTIGYPGIPSQESYLATMLAADGLTLDDIELVNIGYELVPALISGRVDASLGSYWTHETILAEREGYPVEMLRVDEWGVPLYYELVLVASDDRVAADPELVSAFLGAVQHGYTDAIADPEAALDALAAASPELEREVETAGIELLVPVWTEGVPYFGVQTSERWEEYAAWMAENELIPADLDVADAFTTELLPTTE